MSTNLHSVLIRTHCVCNSIVSTNSVIDVLKKEEEEESFQIQAILSSFPQTCLFITFFLITYFLV